MRKKVRTVPARGLSHLDGEGRAVMVDVSSKQDTDRVAVATATVRMGTETLRLIVDRRLPKGDVLATARIAGIMAAKQTPALIPLCHPLNLASVTVEFEPDERLSALHIRTTARLFGKTGVEMEALTAAAVAALTLYDMCKAVDKGIVITDICLVEKHGGKSGSYANPAARSTVKP